VAHVHGAARIRQHFENVIFRLLGVNVGFEYARFRPALLPLGFDFLWVVIRHAARSPSYLDFLRLLAAFRALPGSALFDFELAVFLAGTCASIFFFSAGVSIEKPFSASGA
jgi:hypothetical protein